MKRLTSKFVASVTEPGKYHDGDAGLFLHVQERNGKVRKSYLQRLTIFGKRVDLGLGSAKWTTPSEARAMAQANRKIARTGGDPRIGRQGAVPSFEQGAEAVIAIHRDGWKDGAKSEAQWRASLRDYAYPRLGRRPVSTITTADILAVLIPIWHAKPETAKRVRQRIGAVMDWAAAEGHRTDNPCHALKAALPKGGNGKRHHRALPFDRVSGALAAVAASGAWWATKAAFRFLTLTAARSGEVRGATWAEIDLDAATWTIPVARAKTGRDHRVPLSGAALEVLREARPLSGGEGLVFPSVTGRVMSDSTMSKLLKENQIGAVPHGFRSSFRDWAAERTNTPREIVEHALAHVEGSASELAYRRTDYFEKRRQLMEAWARHLAAEKATVRVLKGGRGLMLFSEHKGRN